MQLSGMSWFRSEGGAGGMARRCRFRQLARAAARHGQRTAAARGRAAYGGGWEHQVGEGKRGLEWGGRDPRQ